MDYEGDVIRPPSEADSIILQVTRGCSHNRCTFCGAYKGVRFRIREEEALEAGLDFAARHCQALRRVFLADGDALVIPQKKLLAILARIKARLPWIKRVGLYGNARSILGKSPAELQELASLGLDRVYMGLESGDDQVLESIAKGSDSRRMIEAGQRVRQAGLFLSVTVLLGIAGTDASRAHAEATGRVLTAMAPNQIAALTLMLLPNTALYQDWRQGFFLLPDSTAMLRELRTLVEHIELDRVQFHANHASNYLPIAGRLQRDKNAILQAIDRAMDNGRHLLVPEHHRRL